MKPFWNSLSFWVITIQAIAALLATIHRFPVSTGWENIRPKWSKLNKAVAQLNPENELAEKFLGVNDPGFNELLDLIDENFFGLPNKTAIRGITNRRDEYISKSGAKIVKTVNLWIDFGDGQYLKVASRNALLEKIREKRAMVFFTAALYVFLFGLFLRYVEFFISYGKVKS